MHQVRVGNDLLGQVLDGFGRPLADGCAGAFARPPCDDARAVVCDAPLATHRPRIGRALPTGVRAIDGLLTLGEGQRVGLFAGAGCGKTTLLAEIARNVECDVIVFGLIGERGRELREFLDHELDDGLRANGLGITERDVTNSMVASLAGSSQVAPTFWLNPQNGVSYGVVASPPRIADWPLLPVTGKASSVGRLSRRYCGVAATTP